MLALGVAAGLLACGEGPSNPARRIMAVVTSRDSVYLDVADTVVDRAEARDVNGDAIPDAAITWRSLDGAVAGVTVSGVTARIFARAHGVTGVVASSDDRADTTAVTVLPPIIATTLASHLDTAWALGDTFAIAVSSQSASGPRFGQYAALSRTAAASAAFDAEANLLRVTARLPSEAYVVVTERRGTRDSALVVVRQRPTSVIATPEALSGFPGRSSTLLASVRDARNNTIPGRRVAWSSSDTAIVGVSAGGLVSYRGVGTARIFGTDSPGLVDTVPVTVLPKPKVSLSTLEVGQSNDSLTIGAHQLSYSWYAYASDAISAWVHLRTTDTSIATAPDSVMYVGTGATFTVRGRRPGRTLLISEATLLAPDTVAVRVTTPRLQIGDPVDPVPLAIRGTDNVRFAISTTDSSGTPHPIADTLIITFRSSDSSVVDLFQNRDPYVLIQAQGGRLFSAHALDTGRALIRATAPGYVSDSMAWRVLPGPKLRFMQGRTEMLGAGQSTVELRQLASIGPEAPGDTVSVTLTQRRPATAAVPSTLTLTGYTGTGLIASYSVDALLPGTDTIIATAAAHQPDTAVITVTTPRILLPDTIRGTILGAYADVFVGDSLGVRHAPTDALLLLATSSDTAVARGASTRIPARWLALWPLGFPAVDTGSATITVRDSAGRYPPKLVIVRFGLDSSLHVVVDDGYEYGPAATGQRFEDTRFLLLHPYLPSPPLVYLSTTEPGVLRLPDSVLAQGSGYTYFAAAGGDIPGTTRIVARTHGFRPDTSAPITVGRGRLKLDAPTTAFVGGAGYVASVHARSPNGLELPMNQDLTATLVPIDPGAVPQSASVTVPAGQAVSPATAVTFTAPGLLRFAAQDRRPVPAPFLGDTVVIRSQLPWLRLSGPFYDRPTVGVGQRLAAFVSRPDEVKADPITIEVSRRGSRSASAPTVVLQASATTAQYAIDGRAVGTDTVTLAAPGYAPDTVPLFVTEGRAVLANWPGALRTGDSVAVRLQVGDSALVGHAVVEPATFTIETSGGIQISDGARSIAEVTVPAGSGVSGPIYVKGTAAGSAALTLTNLYYAPATFTTNVIAAATPERP
ncbi:MAG: hypothetical protein AUH23_00280 [Gemmatimonadetes bacterium 13_2_20CM_1_69_27]|nr:MAG: hypothetical protein AUH23_00280 [Gemmatimonadetes bacterium 13_2_20CM_1_69_27]